VIFSVSGVLGRSSRRLSAMMSSPHHPIGWLYARWMLYGLVQGAHGLWSCKRRRKQSCRGSLHPVDEFHRRALGEAFCDSLGISSREPYAAVLFRLETSPGIGVPWTP
jgi:hypothetical protein